MESGPESKMHTFGWVRQWRHRGQSLLSPTASCFSPAVVFRNRSRNRTEGNYSLTRFTGKKAIKTEVDTLLPRIMKYWVAIVVLICVCICLLSQFNKWHWHRTWSQEHARDIVSFLFCSIYVNLTVNYFQMPLLQTSLFFVCIASNSIK